MRYEFYIIIIFNCSWKWCRRKCYKKKSEIWSYIHWRWWWFIHLAIFKNIKKKELETYGWCTRRECWCRSVSSVIRVIDSIELFHSNKMYNNVFCTICKESFCWLSSIFKDIWHYLKWKSEIAICWRARR